MKRDTVFFRQAELLLRVLPLVNEEEVFALKGGTAINFFLRDLPRLSIDIDLTYLPINDRETALFDIDMLFKNEGLTEKVRKAFIVYLVSHSRPMVEILNPQWGGLRPVFEREFQGMVVEPITAEELRIVGEQLISRLHEEMTQEERRFIVSVKGGKPRWDLLGVPGIENLPAVQWKLQNIRRMAPMKHREALRKLRDLLGV